MQRKLLWLFTASLMCLSGSAIAETQNAADTLFWKGREEIKKGHIAEGLDLFTRSQALEPSKRTEMNIADCEVKLGKVVSPLKRYKNILKSNISTWKYARYVEDKVAELESRVARLYINRPPLEPRGLAIRLDGEVISQVDLRKPISLDPGKHELIWSAPGFVSQSRIVMAKEGQWVRTHPVVLQSQRIVEEKKKPRPAQSSSTKVGATVMSGGGLIFLSGVGLLIEGRLTNKDGEAVFDQSASPKAKGWTNTAFAWTGIGQANAGRDYVLKGGIVASVGGTMSLLGLATFLVPRLIPSKKPIAVSAHVSPSWLGVSTAWSF